MRLELAADHVVVPLGVRVAPVHDVDEHARALDVPEEGVAEARAARRALDEARDVGDRGPPAVVRAQLHDAEVGLERGERVRRDLRGGRGQRREQRRLAGVGEPHEADLRDQAQLQAEPPLDARLALLRVAGRLVRRGREVDVPEAAAPAAGDHRGLPGRDEVRDELAGRVVEGGRPRRHVDLARRARLPVPARALAAPAVAPAEVVRVPEVAERGLAGVHAKDHRSAASAVAAVGTAAGHVRLATEGGGAVTAGARLDPDLHTVEEHGLILARGSAGPVGAGAAGPMPCASADVRERVDAGAAAPRVAAPHLEVEVRAGGPPG